MLVKSFSIQNFRSLVDTGANNLAFLTVFHGENNAGKSNILSALECIFARKLRIEEAITPTRSNVDFWYGEMPNFQDNFNNLDRPIDFYVEVECSENDKKKISAILKKVGADSACNKISFEGSIAKSGNSARFNMSKVVIDEDLIAFEYKDGNQVFFTSSALSTSIRSDCFDDLMKLFNNCFKVVNTHRALVAEKYIGTDVNTDEFPTFQGFKNWLFTLANSRPGNEKFELIKDIFNEEPFKFGEISFDRNGDSIEIMLRKDSIYLPISRMGSGLQQILYILSLMVSCDSPIIGIEELEMNLSPNSVKKLVELVRDSLIARNLPYQVFITSHSPYFSKISKTLIYGVTIDDKGTKVRLWNDPELKAHFGEFKSPGGWSVTGVDD